MQAWIRPLTAGVSMAALVMSLMLVSVHNADAQGPSQAGSSLSPASQAVWDREWSLYASRYTFHEGEYYACAKYHPMFPSSQGVTAQALVERNTRSRTVTYSRNMSRQVRTVPNLTDAQVAVVALPAVSFGEYGHLHSVEIVQIMGPKQMLVRHPWLIDAQALNEQIRNARAAVRERNQEEDVEHHFQFRQQLADRQRQEDSFRSGGILLIGFDTEDLQEGQRWLGPQKQGLDVAITGTKVIQYVRSRTSRSGSSTRSSSTRSSARPRELEVAVALPVSEFRGRISRTQFDDLLTRRGMTLEAFIDLTIAEKKKDADQAIFNAIRKLEARKDAPSSETGGTGSHRSLDD